jgi:hypothetical protein
MLWMRPGREAFHHFDRGQVVDAHLLGLSLSGGLLPERTSTAEALSPTLLR